MSQSGPIVASGAMELRLSMESVIGPLVVSPDFRVLEALASSERGLPLNWPV
ncbi:MAG TPA: hypothetical protein VFJ72_01060 [Rubrobacteraceae bacterium]|nr:hypothetical protein [Rubrobacteraceae bacterium]